MKKFSLMLIIGFSFLRAFAQPDPVKFRFFCNKSCRNVLEICIEARIDKGWQMYFKKMADGDPVKSGIRFKPSPYYHLSGPISRSGAINAYDDGFDMNVEFFTGKALFIQTIVTKSAKAKIIGTFEYLASNDTATFQSKSIKFIIKTCGLN